MIEKRSYHSVVAFRENIYVIGGLSFVDYLRSAEKFDTSSKQWTLINSIAISRFNFGTPINGHKLYCVRGDNWKRLVVEYFDLYSEVWGDEGRMPATYGLVSAVTIYDV